MPRPPEPPAPRSPEEDAAIRMLAQILANVIRRDVDEQLKASRRVVKSV